MTLTLVFRIQAVFLALMAIMMFTQLEMMAADMSWTVTPGLTAMAEHMAAAAIGFAVISWVMPSLAGDNIKQAGMIMGVYLGALFIIMPFYHMATELIPTNSMTLSMQIPPIVIWLLFIWKSRASD
ncbi:MAG: hypothetical protein QGG88_01510 [Gammaproteobacteria bacterium]|jgi:hypothetical protein|nr:hypothetical protein [Gammaproteobacteria bacterium]